jgi:AcrR family transcriptional regulator
LSARRRKRPEKRRDELIAAAWEVFGKKGVARSAVSDIVKAAGVAQGTFYLYFKAKTDIVNAVAEQMVDGMVDAVERAVTATDTGAVDKLLALRDAILAVASDAAGQELAEIYHRPENREVHDRMAERVAPRLAPLVESIVRQGVDEGVFTAEDPRVAAWFVLGGLHMLEAGFAERAELPAAISSATTCALRALGHTGT